MQRPWRKAMRSEGFSAQWHGTRAGVHVKVFESASAGEERVFTMDSNPLKSFFSDERGTETVEWAMMTVLIVGGLVLIVAAIGSWVEIRFVELQEDLQGNETCCD